MSVENISYFNDIDSIDEAAERLDRSLEGNGRNRFVIPPEVEFWGHCSNLQVWEEMDYDTRILHSNLAFPLLKKLTEIGDPIAKKVLKEEIAKRLRSGNINTILYLFEQKLINFLNKEEREFLYLKNNPKLRKLIDIYIEPSGIKGKNKKPIKRQGILKILNELVKMGDDYAKEKVRDYLIFVKKRKPLPLKIETFWEIIERTRRKSNDDAFLQEKLIINELLTYSIEDISVFDEIFSFFTSKLQDNEGLARELVKNFEIFLSDDGWYYLCLGVVGLGKELYTMALYEAPKFIKLLKTGKFGHPRNLEYEFYAIMFKVMDELLGSSEIEDIWALEEIIDVKPLREKIRNELDSWYLNEFKQRIEEKNPETIAYLAINDFFDDLPIDYLVEVLLDKELNKIWLEEHFAFPIFSDHYFSKLDTSISLVIRDKFIESIKNNKFEDFLNFLGSNLFNNLNEEDFSIIIKNPNYSFFRVLFKALIETKEHEYLLGDGLSLFYSSEGPQYRILKEEASQYIDSINNGNIEVNLKLFLESRILNLIEDVKIITFFGNKNLLANSVQLANKYYLKFGEWFYHDFLKRMNFSLSSQILNCIHNIVEVQDKKLLLEILKSPLLNSLHGNDLTILFADPFSNFYQLFFKCVESLNYIDYYEPVIPKKIVKTQSGLILKSFTTIAEKGTKKEIIQIFRFCFFYELNVKSIVYSVFKDSDIKFVDFLILLREKYYEDVDLWIRNHLKECSKEGILKNYIITQINNGDQQGFLNFLEKNFLSYIEKKNIINLFQDENANFFEFLFQAVNDTKSYWILSDIFVYPYFDELKPIVKNILLKYLTEGDLLKITFLFVMRSITSFLRTSEIRELFYNKHFNFLEVLSKVLYYNTNSEDFFKFDDSLEEDFHEEFDLILSRLKRKSQEFLKDCVLRVLDDPDKFVFFFIVNCNLIKYLPPVDFIGIVEKDENVLEGFLEAVNLIEILDGEKPEWVSEYLEPVFSTMSPSLKEKLNCYRRK